MITKTDVRLQFQKEFGGSLDSIDRKATSSKEAQPYIDWLEDRVAALSQGIEAWESANTIAVAAQKAVKKHQ